MAERASNVGLSERDALVRARSGWSLPLVPGPDGSLPDQRAQPVEDTLRLLLEIVPGERPLRPEFGCRIHFLGNLASPQERGLAACLVEEAIERWAPELGADRVEVSPLKGSQAEISVRIGETWHRVQISLRSAEATGTPVAEGIL